MKKVKLIKILFLIIFVNLINFSSAAHFIIGEVKDALGGELADGKIITLWNPNNGRGDNLTDIIGLSGNSQTSNYFMIDCELLSTPCTIGDEIKVKIFNNGSDYVSPEANLSVTGAGFDQMPFLRLNSKPIFYSMIIEDDILSPSNEIDLTPADTKTVKCEAVFLDYDGNTSIVNASANFFDNNYKFSTPNDNNYHYSNQSCGINNSYGNSNQTKVICDFQVWYYANNTNWNCTILVQDNYSIINSGSNLTLINDLLAIEINTIIDYSTVNAASVSDEQILNVSNAGNVKLNLSLKGFGATEEDSLAMNCSIDSSINISIEYEKFNLTKSNPGAMNLATFENLYKNLSSNSKVYSFNLTSRENDAEDETAKSTYWRIYLPPSVSSESCTGNIIFGATTSEEN